MQKIIFVLLAVVCLAGCAQINMPTPPDKIVGSYVSDEEYRGWSCERLATEYESLRKKEQHLITAQTERYSASEKQAFWWGAGNGDSYEAVALSDTRGRLEAVKRGLAANMCPQ